jgi:hypothetical protein
VISNRLKRPITDRALIRNGLYELVIDRFNLCNGLNLTRPLQRIHVTGVQEDRNQKSTLVTGVAEPNPGVRLARLSVTDAKQQPLQMWVHVTSVKGPLQMLRDLFEVFT